MKKNITRWILPLAAVLPYMSITQSCMKDSQVDYELLMPNAIVTVKPAEGTPSFFLQLDDQTTLEPVNMQSSPFGEDEVRALVNYTETSEPSELYDKAVYINWIEKVLTKELVEDKGEENDNTYGNDPIELADSWVNIAEDGYLTLQFLTRFGNTGIAHEVNLINAGTEEDPYIVEFRHNAHGDYGTGYGSGIAAFRLDGLESGLGLPDTQGETVDLTLKYMSFSGEKSVTFKYCTRKATEDGEIDTQKSFDLKLK